MNAPRTACLDNILLEEFLEQYVFSWGLMFSLSDNVIMHVNDALWTTTAPPNVVHPPPLDLTSFNGSYSNC